MAKLKPCECGKKAAVQSDGWRVWYSVSCECGLHTNEYRTEQEAIEAWNRRAGDTDAQMSV